MDQINPLNVFRGPGALVQYYDPNSQPPLPLVEIPDKLNPFCKDGVKIYAKMMTALPAHNVKSLPSLNMLLDKGVSSNTKTIVEQSSGSTVISLSIIARLLHGIEDVRAYITNKTSPSRMKMLRFFGLQLVLYGGPHQPEPLDPRGGICKARQLAEQNNGITNPNQYQNPLNPDSHVRWTGPQILRQLPEINVLCAPMGTGGVVTGTGSFLKKSKPGITVVGVCNANGDPVPGPRPFPLFAQVKFPWRDAVDTVEEISSYESYRLSMLLSREGLICGPSSGMTLQGLYNFLQNHKDRGNLHSLAGPDGNVCCVFMCCDLPYQYLDDYFAKLGEDQFRPIVNENLINADLHLYDNGWEIEPSAAMNVLFRNLTETPLQVDPTVNGSGVANDNLPTNGTSNTIDISPKASHPPLTEKSPILLDLRSPSDFAAFHLPHAINLPLASLRENDVSPYEDSLLLEAQWLELETLFREAKLGAELWTDFKGRRVVLACYGGDTARIASSVLRASGVEAISIRGGMREFVGLAKLTADPP